MYTRRNWQLENEILFMQKYAIIAFSKIGMVIALDRTSSYLQGYTNVSYEDG